MQIVENILTTSPCYKSGKTITPKGLMIHSVGCPQPNATVFVNTWKTSITACVHAVLGADGKVYQCLPWNRRAWHAGSPSNDIFISIELTEPSTIKYTGGANFTDNNPAASKAHVVAVYNHAVEFAAYICKLYGFDPTDSNQLLSHSEGYKKGYATNHSDVEHMWSKYGLTMDRFRADVKAKMSGSTPVVAIPCTSSNAATDGTIIKVTVSKLNIRSGAGTSYPVTGTITDKGTYTITEISNGWGKLKSEKGWISLSYTNYPGNTASTSSAPNVTTSTAYTVKITANTLNVRKGVGTAYLAVGTVKKNEVYTIAEEQSGWGKLKSGAGWIALEYTTKV